MRKAGTTILLISLLSAAAIWMQPDRAPKTVEPPPAPRGLDPRDARHLLERFMAQDERADPPEAGLRFDRERRTGVTEARLLALAMPDTVRALLERSAADPARSPRSRDFAVRILAFLPGADEVLVRLAPSLPAALRELCRRDPRGDHLPVYLAAGDAEALSHWTDPRAVVMLKRLAAFDDGARRLVERHELLRSADWAPRLEALLVTACHERPDLTPWALHAARSRALPGLASLLRERLDEDVPDEFRDDVLLAVSDLGGALTDSERARLEFFGYLGDPEARLLALLGRR